MTFRNHIVITAAGEIEICKETLKSIGAVIAGFAALVILSTITDSILEKTGVMKTQQFAENPAWLIATIILYRTIFNTFGCYLTARIAPNKPMNTPSLSLE